MNLLVDRLPTDYEGLKINTNFRSFILYELLMQDNELKKEEKILLAINLLYEEKPQDLKKAIQGIVWFYECGEEKKQKKVQKTNENAHKKQIYSFEYDAKYIYSAFKHDYGIDLNEIDYLHWFKFKSLFECLNSENRICEIMSYRGMDLSKIKDKKERDRYKKLQRQYALPDNRTIEQKEQDFANALW